MDFTLSPEQLLIKDSVARFAAGAHAGTEKWPQFAELGWLAIGAPDDLGGFGGPIETLLLMEQFGRGLVVSPYVAQVVLAGTLLRAAERTELLERLVEGTERFAVAYEEPHARYDPAAVETSAVRDPSVNSGQVAYVLRGTKVRVLDAGTANTLIVSARTGDGISLFAVPANAANVSLEKYASEDGYDVANVRLDGVRVDAAQLVGPARRRPRAAGSRARSRDRGAVRGGSWADEPDARSDGGVHEAAPAVRRPDRFVPSAAAPHGRDVHRGRACALHGLPRRDDAR